MRTQSLSEIQHNFWLLLHNSDAAFVDAINSDDDFDAIGRINVYRTTARSIHVSALANTYVVCKAILGRDYFRLIAKRYFTQHSSSSFDLNDYGESFSGYLSMLLEQREELKDFEYLADLAKLEWMIHKSHHIQDVVKFEINKFQKQCELLAGEIQFSLNSSISVIETCYPIADIWSNHQESKVVNNVMALTESECLCIYRINDEVKIEKIDKSIKRLIYLINKKITLKEIADDFDESSELNAALQFVISRQWLRIR